MKLFAKMTVGALLLAITGCGPASIDKQPATPPSPKTPASAPAKTDIAPSSTNLAPTQPATTAKPGEPAHFRPYLDFLQTVFDKMNGHYYKPVSEELYRVYVEKYKQDILSKLPSDQGRIDMIAWRGAGLLVYALRQPGDTFTNFIPPEEAKAYAQKAYGYENGIGVDGHLTPQGYLIDHIQIRSDAFRKGVTAGDLILKINDREIAAMSADEIRNALFPPLKTLTRLTVFSPPQKTTAIREILCEEYFVETVKTIPTGIPDVYCLKIASFNQKTAEDLKNYIRTFGPTQIRFLIIDLTDNPGGPPLAVYELSGLFMPPNQKLFYYQKKDTPEFGLISSESDIRYDGPLAVMVNKGSGSSSELLAGTFQEYGRAVIVGKEHTAGMAFLKTTFTFDDGSMLALITGSSYYFNGKEFGLDGVAPDVTVPADTADILTFLLDRYKSGDLTRYFKTPRFEQSAGAV